MSRVIIVIGSPRAEGNSDILGRRLARGARDAGAEVEIVYAADLNIKHCTGCLRCNLVEKCVLRNDDWAAFAEKFTACDAAAFVTPIYFHWMTSHLKVLIDRFRSLMHVRIRPDGLEHTPTSKMPRRCAYISVLGSPREDDALPVMRFFRYVTEMWRGEVVGEMIAAKLALRKQVGMSGEELAGMFAKMGLGADLAESYHETYQDYLRRAYEMGRALAVD